MLDGIKQYLPSLGMVLATFLGTLTVALNDNTVSASELFMLVTSALGAVTVYIVPKFNNFAWLKTGVAAVTAAVTFAGAAFVSDGISSQEWVMIIIQFLGGLGIVVGTQSFVPLTRTA